MIKAKIVAILENDRDDSRNEVWNRASCEYGDRVEFSRYVTTKDLTDFIDELDESNLHLVFAHKSDLIAIEREALLVNKCVERGIALVTFTGEANTASKLAGTLLQDLSHSTLVENLNNFLDRIAEVENIGSEHLELLLRIDPELERLLEPFAKAGPFANEPELQQAKAVLIAYVNSLGADA
ncbi:MAG: hypothetical protein KF881_01515 [Acidobacteria bacterium]|nr:hypothetical protein [Acidobacteriota bacterium]